MQLHNDLNLADDKSLLLNTYFEIQLNFTIKIFSHYLVEKPDAAVLSNIKALHNK